MGIDINLLRPERGGDPEKVRASEIRRCRSGSIVEKIQEADAQWRRTQFLMENIKKELNATNKEIGTRKKADRNASCEDLMAVAAKLKSELAAAELSATDSQAKLETLVAKVGNIVPADVRASQNEDENEVLRTWGQVNSSFLIDSTPGHYAHYELLAKINGVDLERGAEVAGHRGYYLKGYGVMLVQALIQYGLSFMRRRGYTDIQPPYFLKREVMTGVSELADFEETLYRIPMGSESSEAGNSSEKEKKDRERDDLFLIATSEQPICALHRNENLEEKSLPIKYCGISSCFRKEAGSHGKDMKGIFRIHQFEKVEQFVICKPEDSWKMQDEMIRISEEFYQSLKLPYRVVCIVAGALNEAAARKFDLEAWFPSYQAYRELVSCSNCLDYQSRAMNIRLGHPKLQEREKAYVHMLNGTLTAAQRTLCCILEHYQKPNGIEIPYVLQPYMDGMTFIPFP